MMLHLKPEGVSSAHKTSTYLQNRRYTDETESALAHAQAQVELVPLKQQWISYVALQNVRRAAQLGKCAMEINII